ncbi:NifU family protein [Haloactinomyces albus]|uniref:Fe-S cluster biogenesis protein NfuA n=1 Tax=Haloactinomyces albus TaxID=1352928 RepID=A0AAE3Z803_9ACTN|nr:NifU family protein [Haloactinomyces albus]MDR7300047.1 Fe-S cluster biogenesis protein NfuA [Haloactinomyces albus]
MPWDNEQAREQVRRVESALSALESQPEAITGARAVEAVETLVAVYGDCLARVMQCIEESGHGEVTEALATDELVSHLLLVHDLHPVDTETRVQQALEEVRHSLGSHGGEIHLAEVADGVVRVRIEVQGCPSTVEKLRLAVEEAIAKAAPDIERVEAEEATSETAAVIPVEALFSGGRVAETG